MKLPIRLFLGVILLLCMQISHAQQSFRLTDHWEFTRQDLGGIWEATRPVVKGNPESVPLWQNVVLPHCVNATDAVDPDVNYYQGPAWYRTTIDVENPYPNGRTLLHFEGAGQKTEAYIYNTKVGSHTGGYDEFVIDITEAVAAFKKTAVFQSQFKGKVPISIRTDNSRDLQMIPSNLSDFNVYGGIYRYLNLLYQPSLSVAQLFATPQVDVKGKTGTVHVRARLYNPLSISSADIHVRLLSPQGKALQQKTLHLTQLEGDVDIADLSISKPLLWSPQLPSLYTIELEVVTGNSRFVQKQTIGFRQFEFVRKGPFYLNGERLLLRGTQRHEDHAGVGAAMTEDMIRSEMIMIKEMGANFIRLGHYQQSRIVLDLCDSLGILAWEEIPWCRGGLGGDLYQNQAKGMLTHMIEQHYNHPSIIIWGLGNENDWPGDFETFDQEKIRAFMKELNTLSHQLDTSRKTAIRRCDFCKDIVDVYSPSIWAGWYRGIYTEYRETSKKEMEQVDHFLHAEWGGDSHAGRHSENPDQMLQQIKTGNGADERAGDASLYGGAARVSKDGDWSESYIVNLFDWHLKEQENMPWLTGSAQWVFKDFSTPVRPENPIPYVNQKGVVERDLTKKEGYYVFQSYWASKPMVHVYGHTWPIRWGKEGEEKMVKVYSNCEEVELFVNGKSYGVKKRNSQDFPAAGLRWILPFASGDNVIKAVARKGATRLTDEIRFQYQTRQWGKPARMVLQKVEEGEGIATVAVTLLDEQNIQCLDATNFVRFGLTGDGSLIDNQGTSTGSKSVQVCNGRVLIKVRTQQGASVVSVTSDGLPTVFLSLSKQF